MPDCLLILGMHRCGTSAVAGACSIAGAAFGGQLVEAQEDNVRGYFEDERVLDIHERFLATVESSWDDIALSRTPPHPSRSEALARELQPLIGELAESRLGAIKDPRLSRLLELWLPLLAAAGLTPRLLIVWRDPGEVAASLARRDGFSSEKSGLLWADHLLCAERASRNVSRAFVAFEELLEDPAGTLDRAADNAGFEWPTPPSEVATELRDFVSPGLRHWSRKDGNSAADLGRASAVCENLRKLLESGRPEAGSIDAVHGELLAKLGAQDPLVVPHLLAVLRRERQTTLWSATKVLESEIEAQVARLDGAVAERDERSDRVEERLELLAASLEQGAADTAAVAAEFNRNASHVLARLDAIDARVHDLSSNFLVRWIRRWRRRGNPSAPE